MSRLVNYPTGWVVTRNNYVGDTANDIYQRNQVEASVLPCIYNGFQASINSGLVATVSPGTARGDDLEYTQSVGSPNLPSEVSIATPTNVTCTANSTGWIVLNITTIGTLAGVPQTPGPTVPADYYDVTVNNGSGSVLPVFVTSLAPSGPQPSFPFTQIVLAQVTTNATDITSINMGSGSDRSFDWSRFLSPGGSGVSITGDIKQSYNPAQSTDWVEMNDGTLGSADSGSTYAGAIYQDLYELLWNQIPNVWCPVFTSAGAPTTRGGSAAADFAADVRLMMPATVGRALCNTGTGSLSMAFTADSSTDIITVPTTSSLYTGTPVTVSNTGGALPAPLAAATTYYVVNVSGTTISLSTTRLNANNQGDPPIIIDLTTDGSGVNTLTVNYSAYVSGQIVGEEGHQNTAAETGAHPHPVTYYSTTGGEAAPRIGQPPQAPSSFNTGPNLGDQPHNTMQPSAFVPVWIHI